MDATYRNSSPILDKYYEGNPSEEIQLTFFHRRNEHANILNSDEFREGGGSFS